MTKQRTKGETKGRKSVRPKAIPSLTKEQFKVVITEMQRMPCKADYARAERVKEILKNL